MPQGILRKDNLMKTSVDNFVDVKGITPRVQVATWGEYITIRVEIGDAHFTSYVNPLTGESVDDYAQRIVAAFGEAAIKDVRQRNAQN